MENKTIELVGDIFENYVPLVNLEIYQMIQTVNYVGISQVFGLMGVVTNIINMIVFITIGFKDTINISLFVLSLSDFGACLFGSSECIFANPWIRKMDLTFDPIPVTYIVISYPRIVLVKITTILTAFISFERCISVTMPLKVKSIFTHGRVKAANVITWIAIFGTSAPYYAYNRLAIQFYPHLNKSIYSLVYTEEKGEIENMYYTLYNFFYSVVAFVLVAIFTAILVISLQRKATWRKSVTTVTTTNRDSTRERRVSKTVITISSLFIVCYSPEVVSILYMTTDPTYAVMGSKAYILLTVASFVHVLGMINSSVNLFIYYHNSSVYKNMFDCIFYSKFVQTNQQKTNKE